MTSLSPKTSNDLRPDMKDILPTHSSLSSAFNAQRLISKTDKKKIENVCDSTYLLKKLNSEEKEMKTELPNEEVNEKKSSSMNCNKNRPSLI